MISPLDATHLPDLSDRMNAVPARHAAGIRLDDLALGEASCRMDVPDWLIGPDGIVFAGALGILVDAALGGAAASALPQDRSLVTTHLTLELTGPVRAAAGPLSCVGRITSSDDDLALSAGEVLTADGRVVARATIGSLMLGNGQMQGPAPMAEELGEPAPLGMTATRDGDTVTARTPAHRWLANSYGGVHGGAGFLVGDRTLQLAMGPTMRVVELHAVFVRPIPADGHDIVSTASVAHRGRRFGAARGTVLAPSGKPALLVDATYLEEN